VGVDYRRYGITLDGIQPQLSNVKLQVEVWSFKRGRDFRPDYQDTARACRQSVMYTILTCTFTTSSSSSSPTLKLETTLIQRAIVRKLRAERSKAFKISIRFLPMSDTSDMSQSCIIYGAKNTLLSNKFL
jgi:hypothetical protein